MNVPPYALDLTVDTREGRHIRLWLPILLLWPLFFALGVLAFVVTLVVDTLLLVFGQRYHHYSLLLFRSFEALTETRGMVIRFKDGDSSVDMTLL